MALKGSGSSGVGTGREMARRDTLVKGKRFIGSEEKPVYKGGIP